MFRRGLVGAAGAGLSAVLSCCSSFDSSEQPPPSDAAVTDEAAGPEAEASTDAGAGRPRLYLIGGGGPSGPTREIFAASILDDGMLGSWELAGMLPEPLQHMAAGALGDTVIVAGGRWPGSPPENAPSSSVVLQRRDGGLAAFPAQKPFGARAFPAAVVVRERMYLSGGLGTVSGGEVLFRDFRDFDSTLGWQPAAPMPGTRYDHGMAAQGDLIFATGGRAPTDDAGTNERHVDTVVFSKVLSDRTLAPWSPSTSLPYADSAHQLVAHGGFLFLLAGRNEHVAALGASALVRSARIDDAGTLGAWGVVAEVPGGGRANHAAVVVGDSVYVVGGYVKGVVSADVEVARFDGLGGVEPWRKTSPLPAPRAFAAIVAF